MQLRPSNQARRRKALTALAVGAAMTFGLAAAPPASAATVRFVEYSTGWIIYDGDEAVGLVDFVRTGSFTKLLEVCDARPDNIGPFGRINPENDSRVLEYGTDGYGTCTTHTINYPVRKWRAAWNGVGSPWRPSP